MTIQKVDINNVLVDLFRLNYIIKDVCLTFLVEKLKWCHKNIIIWHYYTELYYIHNLYVEKLSIIKNLKGNTGYEKNNFNLNNCRNALYVFMQ